MAETKKTKTEEPAVEQEEMVKIRLPMIPGVEKQEALYVGVNDRSWVIPRGIPMEVPKCVAEVIEHSETEAFRAEEYRNAHAM